MIVTTLLDCCYTFDTLLALSTAHSKFVFSN